MESKLFTPVTFGPLTLRNRTIRSAAFESMCPGNAPSDMLLNYHRSVAAGGIGMTTVAYAAVTRSGLSFDRQLWMRPEIIPGLRRLTDAVHAEGAAAGIQLGHCGNMSHKSICAFRRRLLLRMRGLLLRRRRLLLRSRHRSSWHAFRERFSNDMIRTARPNPRIKL